jgi:hypothetical protein
MYHKNIENLLIKVAGSLLSIPSRKISKAFNGIESHE